MFVDTSAWYALVNPRATEHAIATRTFRRIAAEQRRLMTTNHVVAECYTLTLRRLGFPMAQALLQRFRTSRSLERIFVESVWEDAAEDLLARFDDQPFSYVDATSFVAMRRLGLRDAFAYDRHFATAGFTLVSD